MVYGEAIKRSHVEIDSAVFSAQPILSVLRKVKYDSKAEQRAFYSCPAAHPKAVASAERDTKVEGGRRLL